MNPLTRVQKRNKKRPMTSQPHVRCYTRALKNARHLQKVAPDLYAKDLSMEGFGTGVPVEILRGLHRIRHDSPILSRYQAVAETLRKHPLPSGGQPARDALFQGTVHFAQLTFHTSTGDKVMSTSDMNQIVQYATHAVVP